MKRACLIFSLLIMSVTVSQAQWSPLNRISYAGGGYYPDVMAVGDTLHVAYMALPGREASSYVKSINSGQDWTIPTMLSDTSISEASRFQEMAVWGSKIAVFWLQFFRNGNNRHNIGYSISSNTGQSWPAPQYLLDTNAEIIRYFDVCSSDSILNVVYVEQMGSYINHFKAIRSTDFGRTWSSPQEIFQSEDFGLVDMVSFGDRINVVWTGNFDYSRHWEVYHYKSIDGGLSWSGNDTITSPSDNIPSEFPKLSVDEAGNLSLVWMDFRNSPNQLTGDIFMKQSSNGGDSWGPERQITFGHQAWEPEITAHHDSIFVAWVDWRFGMAYLNICSIHSTDNGTTWSSEERMEPELYFCTDPALAFSNGHAYLVFKDMRCMPDTDICGGAFFTKYPADPDRIIDNNSDLLPDEIGLSAYPNPFNSNVVLSYSNLNKGGELEIFNIQGQLIRTFNLTEKEGKIVWDATDAEGHRVSSGIYFAKVMNNDNSKYVKLVYLK